MREIRITLGAPMSVTVRLGVPVALVADAATYDGPYDVTPDFAGTTLYTTGQLMSRNVEVEPITVSRTDNLSGGKTIYIGGAI